MEGSGYVIPAIDTKGKEVTNTMGEKIQARTEVDNPKKAIVYPGVTTVLRVIDKPALQQWRPDCVAAKAVANIDALLNRSPEEGYEYLRFASDEARNDRAEIGTEIHSWIAADLGFGFYPEVESHEVEQMIAVWETFRFEHDINPKWSERTLFNHSERVGGTGDLQADIDGIEDVLVDYKSSRHTYDDNFMQIAGLMNSETEVYELDRDVWYEGTFVKPKRGAIIHIRPDDYDTKGNFIPAFCKLEWMEEEDEPDFYEDFKHATGLAYGRYRRKQKERLRAKAAA